MKTEKIGNKTTYNVIAGQSYDGKSAEIGKILHTKQEIIESIKIIPENSDSKFIFDHYMAPIIEQLSCDISCLYGINFIDIDGISEGVHFEKGFEYLKNFCIENPGSNILVHSLFTKNQLANILSYKNYGGYLWLLDLDNVFYASLDCSIDFHKFEKQIIEYNKGIKKEKFMNNESYFRRMISNKIMRFLHDFLHDEETIKKLSGLNNLEKLKYVFSHESEMNQKLKDFIEEMIKTLELQHPSFKLCDREEKKQGIIDIYDFELSCEVPNGTHYNGVFIDWDGCLYDNYGLKFNGAVLKMIQNYEEEGKAIHIWTGGNLESKQKILDAAGIPYKIESKAQYKGSTVDVMLDNDSADVVYANTKIKAKQHIVI